VLNIVGTDGKGAIQTIHNSTLDRFHQDDGSVYLQTDAADEHRLLGPQHKEEIALHSTSSTPVR
jgi:hypothetical protein